MALRLPAATLLLASGAGAHPRTASPRVLVVGATGGTGFRAIQGLLDSGLEPSALCALTRDSSKEASTRLRAQGVETCEVDLDSDADLASVFRDAWDAVYLHGLAGDLRKADNREVGRAERFLAALGAARRGSGSVASDAGPQQQVTVVFNSAATPPGAGIVRSDYKHKIESLLQDSPAVRSVSLRNHLFMEELWKTYTRPQILKGRFVFSVQPDKKVCLTSVRDVGRVAGRCILEGTPEGVWEVVSDALTPSEMAERFGQAQQLTVRHQENRLFLYFSRFLLPELYRIIQVYRTQDTEAAEAHRADLQAAIGVTLERFDRFLADTRWADPDRTYESLALDRLELNAVGATTG